MRLVWLAARREVGRDRGWTGVMNDDKVLHLLATTLRRRCLPRQPASVQPAGSKLARRNGRIRCGNELTVAWQGRRAGTVAGVPGFRRGAHGDRVGDRRSIRPLATFWR